MAKHGQRRANRSEAAPIARNAVVQQLFAESGSRPRLRELLAELDQYQSEIQAQHVQLLQSQMALEASRDRYSDLFLYAPIGYASLDRNGLVEEINIAAARML